MVRSPRTQKVNHTFLFFRLVYFNWTLFVQYVTLVAQVERHLNVTSFHIRNLHLDVIKVLFTAYSNPHPFDVEYIYGFVMLGGL